MKNELKEILEKISELKDEAERRALDNDRPDTIRAKYLETYINLGTIQVHLLKETIKWS